MPRLFPFFLVSAVIHLLGVLVCGGLLQSRSAVFGLAHGDPDRIFVTVIAEEDVFAQAPTPGQIESAESKPAQPADEKEQPHKEEKTEPILAHNTDAASPEFPETTELTPESPEPDTAVPDMETTQEQSQASLPQVASDPTRLRPALGTDLHDFQARLIAAIREATFFPKQAVMERRHGEVVVTFTVNKDGPVSDICLSRPCGSALLDEAAVQIVKKAAEKFPPFPRFCRQDSITYAVPILFKEKRSRRH
jgi:protein TonB